jgi:predicted SprT family Zn-dependent metalloprotease
VIDGIETVGRAPTTRDELLERADSYAKAIDLDLEYATLDWDISERAKRRAGECRYNKATDEITIVLTWDAYQAHGWETFTGTIRHELVHAWEFDHFGESDHGKRFKRKAQTVDAPRHCQTFTEGRIKLVCSNDSCDWSADRHRASKAVKRPDGKYRCGTCGARYFVRHVASGVTWETHDGYERARALLGDDW